MSQVSNTSLAFLAGLLLKMHEKQSWTAEELSSLQSMVKAPEVAEMAPAAPEVAEMAPAAPEVAEKAPEVAKVVPEVAEKPPAPEPEALKHEAPKKVKKVKKVASEESIAPAPAPAPVANPVPTEVIPAAPKEPEVIPVAAAPELVISPTHCLARMVQKTKVIPGTEANKVYEAKQCIRKRAKGELLCPKCEEFYTAYKEKSKGKANWEGFINEKPLDNLHIVGSKWFQENYPAGLPTGMPSVATPAFPTSAPSDPEKETILAENAPIVEVSWTRIKIGGIHYIYNSADRRTYRADISKEGEDQIIWDSYCGKYINGKIDSYAPESEDVPEEN